MNCTTLRFLSSASIILLLIASQSYPTLAHDSDVSTSSVASPESPLPVASDCFFHSRKISVQVKKGGGSRGGGSRGGGISGWRTTTSRGAGVGGTTTHTSTSSSAATRGMHLSKLGVYSFIGYFLFCGIFLL